MQLWSINDSRVIFFSLVPKYNDTVKERFEVTGAGQLSVITCVQSFAVSLRQVLINL
jgi:hypothetical protein